ncbi:MAG: endonuclease MutS2 [Chloroflexi bacterium HGW-Chloroflexi-3]|nr:MAG: endonuclease MutS2 [Chloroflexi bacterium HGW-Chloroflexi-3]
MMDVKTLHTLEFEKVLEKLSTYAAFSASAELARNIHPSSELLAARERQAFTTETRHLLSTESDITVGSSRDVRPLANRAAQHGMLEPSELLSIRYTLAAARDLSRTLLEQAETSPLLGQLGQELPPPPGIIEAISRVISERGEVLDNASQKLASIRSEIKVAHDRLLSKLNQIIADPHKSKMLQETLITQRNGRYVIPLRPEFKGRISAIIHDQSASGATLFVEPLVTVELNNRWHELQLAERDEIRRILLELSDMIGAEVVQIRAIVDALSRFDLGLMMAKYAEDLDAAEPVLVDFVPRDEDHPGSTIALRHARHPLLDPKTVVPIDVELDQQTFGVVITGPNTGGKTVSLKTIGLLALMAQSGMHIPAQSGSSLCVFQDIFADIGDEQSIEQSLSTFSGHITNITRIFKRANSQSLVLLDELGSGTDPQEGSALARAMLSYLVKRRITCLIATHYPELKAFAHNTPGLINASMEFDLRTLRPTYNLMIGLPGRSNALAISERLGLSKEIIEDARSMVDPTELKAEDLLNEIHRQRSISRKERRKAEISRSEARRIERQLNQRLEEIEDERLAILEKARQAAEDEVEKLQRELLDLRKELARARQPLDALKSIEEKVTDIQDEVNLPPVRKSGAPTLDEQPLRLGEKVMVRSLGMQAVITAISADELEVQIGNLRVRAAAHDVQRPGDVRKQVEGNEKHKMRSSVRKALQSLDESPNQPHSIFHPSPGMELDIRGQLAEDALAGLSNFIESAYLSGMPFVRIIHGKGTGKLRQVVRDALSKNQYVDHWESGVEREGGEGVTISFLKGD